MDVPAGHWQGSAPSPAAPEPCQGHSWCQARAGCCHSCSRSHPSTTGSSAKGSGPAKGAQRALQTPLRGSRAFQARSRSAARKIQTPTTPCHGVDVVPTPRKGQGLAPVTSVTALLRRSQLCDCTPQELRGLKDLHSQKPLLIASKTCFKRPQSPEISHKKANPQRQHSQNRVPVGWVL